MFTVAAETASAAAGRHTGDFVGDRSVSCARRSGERSDPSAAERETRHVAQPSGSFFTASGLPFPAESEATMALLMPSSEPLWLRFKMLRTEFHGFCEGSCSDRNIHAK